MIEAKVTDLESPRLDRVQDLLRSNGPRISILLPPYRPGEQGKSMAALLKTNLQDLAQQFAARQIPEPVTSDLLKPLEELSTDEEFSRGSHFGRVIFRSRDVFQQFELLGPVKAQCVVGGYFQIRPILPDLYVPPEFYLLGLSKKSVELKRCANLRAGTVKLPKGVPQTFDEAMAFKQPDHDLENRSAAGSSTGAMRSVRFGTGSGRETQRAYLADFYRMVDRGITELLHGGNSPLVLAGVDEDTATYRMIHSYPNLLSQGIHGNAQGSQSEQDLLHQAYFIVRAEHVDRTATSLVEWKERLAPARFTTDLETVLRAATDGRVDRLYIDESAQSSGRLPDANHGARWNRGEEDLLNVAAVETILQGGTVFVLPAHKMPDRAAVAAVFRY
jgi:hypothetical protein